jgi:protein-tyrosine-phosphatase
MGEIHAVSEGAEVVVEEPGVDVEGHRCRGVTEHPLDRLDARAARHEEARRRVAEIVRAAIFRPLR